MHGMPRTLIFISLMALHAYVHASEPPHAREAKLSWAAFECSALAQMAGNQDDEKRLRTLGLERGRTFLKKLRDAKLSKAELDDIVPSGMIPSLRMESPDLISGSYSRAAGDFAIERARKDESELKPRFTDSTLAFSHYIYRNCHLIQ